MGSKEKKKRKFSFSTKIIIGLFLGIACGIVFGEYCDFLQIAGDAFVKLLQITILPYITVSLILGIGGLTPEQAKELARKAGLLMLLFWGISFFIVLVMPLSFPHWESAAFYSSSLIEPPKPVDFLNLYIPANPFSSLANNVVPAVVLFSILLGLALMGMKNKDILLQTLSTTTEALIGATGFIVKLTPYGVFAISAAAAGTMTLKEVQRLQVYLIGFNVAALFLTFWLLPRLVSAVTPFKYKDIVGLSRDALLTAFTTGNLFVVLTVLTENCKNLFGAYGLKHEKTDSYVDVIVPVSFNFPNTGKLLMLLFILFAAWFSGNILSFSQYPTFVIAGLLSFFGGVDVAIPFMLDLMRIPTDLYQLYVVTGIVNGRFATLLAAMNLIVFTLLATSAITGFMSINKKRLLNYAFITALLTVVIVGGTAAFFRISVRNVYEKDKVIAHMQSKVFFPVEMKIFKSVPRDMALRDLYKPILQQIRESGVLRVGYHPRNLPFTYINAKGDLVGFDIDMAKLLAQEMNCKLEMIPFDAPSMEDMLSDGYFDIAMSGVPVTTDKLERMAFSEPYMETTLSFIVRDHRRAQFASRRSIQRIPALKIGIPKFIIDYLGEKIKNYLPQAEVIEIDAIEDFFEYNELGPDALLLDAERGAAWTLLYPRFVPVVPAPDVYKMLKAYPIAGGDRAMADFVSQWIRLKKHGPEYQDLYDYWVLGKEAVRKKPRWSVVRNVLNLGN